jgi:hypothetical protein
MNIRKGFVSNSSSSSFIISKTIKTIDNRILPTSEQLQKIKELAGPDNWGFSIGETSQFLIGYTEMDNLDIERFFQELEIPEYLYQVYRHIGWVGLDFFKETINKFSEDYDLK